MVQARRREVADAEPSIPQGTPATFITYVTQKQFIGHQTVSVAQSVKALDCYDHSRKSRTEHREIGSSSLPGDEITAFFFFFFFFHLVFLGEDSVEFCMHLRKRDFGHATDTV